MSSEQSDDRNWLPAPRPQWVEAINAEASHLDIASLIPLDSEHLIARARANTGLEDFGPDDWREPFEVLVRSIQDEAELNLVGRLMTGEDLLAMLEARLQVERAYRLHPQIEDEQIVRPLFILGQPRTGTSALQNLLAADRDNGTIRTFEAWFPAPISDDAEDEQRRIARASALTAMWNRVTPELTSQHEINATIPTECNLIHSLAFRSRTMVHLGQVPSYNAWMANADMAPALRYHARILKLLQFQKGTRHWVLKSPDYITMIPEIISQYPDCGLIYTHRDPVVAFGSVVSLIGTLQWQRSDSVFRHETRDSHIVNVGNVAGLLDRIVEMVESGTVPKEKLLNLQFRDIVRDPLGVATVIYEHFGLALTEQAHVDMQRHVEENRASRKDHSHQYSVGSKSHVAHARKLFRNYQEYFSVSDEI